jgi:hypothetical protein
MNPLGNEILRNAFHDLFGQPTFPEKLGWWICFAPSIEKWIQFEYGFQLSRQLADMYHVGMEQKYVDLAIYDRKTAKPPLWENNTAVAKIELKVEGNWYTRRQMLNEIKADVEKIRSNEQCPGIALVVWFFAKPCSENANCSWITKPAAKQMKLAAGPDGHRRNEEWLNEVCGVSFERITKTSLRPVEGFEEFEVHLYGYRNELAKRILEASKP